MVYLPVIIIIVYRYVVRLLRETRRTVNVYGASHWKSHIEHIARAGVGTASHTLAVEHARWLRQWIIEHYIYITRDIAIGLLLRAIRHCLNTTAAVQIATVLRVQYGEWR